MAGIFLFASFLAVKNDGSLFLNVKAQESDTEEVSEEELEEKKKEAEAEEKEGEAKDLEDELAKIEKEKQQKESQKIVISNDLGQINRNIANIENEIAKTENELKKLSLEIKKRLEEISKMEQRIGLILRDISRYDMEVSLMALGKSGGYEDYFSAVDLLGQMQEKLRKALDQIKKEKENLEGNLAEKENISLMQGDQKNLLESEQNKKQAVLNKTEKDIADKEGEMDELRAEISKLKSDISKLLGKSYEAKDIEEAAKFASRQTGVRRDFLLGMLVVESNLGKFTGGCTYKQVADGAKDAYKKKKLSKSAYEIFQKRSDIFEKICDELDYDWKKMKVSCNPSGYAGTGGAMGVAQFMPDTWRGYEKAISSATGNHPPDPWNLTDGVTGMALKLAKVPGVTSGKKSAECDASKLYLSGTTSSRYDWYCERVQYWSKNYEKLLGG